MKAIYYGQEVEVVSWLMGQEQDVYAVLIVEGIFQVVNIEFLEAS